MALRLITLLLVSVGVSAHLGHSHHSVNKEESQVIRLSSRAVKLPIKTNNSTIDWTQDDQPFRLGDHQFTSLKEFKDTHARCGSSEPSESARVASEELVDAYLKAHRNGTENSTRRLAAITIPIYFHCITAREIFPSRTVKGTCSPAMLALQLAMLNLAYYPDFSFYIADARSYNRPDYYNCDYGNKDQQRRMKEELHQGGMSALNLYTCNPADGYLGWATLPDGSVGGGSGDVKMDGVIIATGTMPGGNAAPFNLGDTATHEVGHWLGLYHTFQGGCSGEGDFISDTPAEATPAYSCDLSRDTCASAGNDPVQNFMDYTEDNCLSQFTTNQRERMIAQWNLYRAGK
jgi:Pregnancy-associated plasma protein-A